MEFFERKCGGPKKQAIFWNVQLQGRYVKIKDWNKKSYCWPLAFFIILFCLFVTMVEGSCCGPAMTGK